MQTQTQNKRGNKRLTVILGYGWLNIFGVEKVLFLHILRVCLFLIKTARNMHVPDYIIMFSKSVCNACFLIICGKLQFSGRKLLNTKFFFFIFLQIGPEKFFFLRRIWRYFVTTLKYPVFLLVYSLAWTFCTIFRKALEYKIFSISSFLIPVFGCGLEHGWTGGCTHNHYKIHSQYLETGEKPYKVHFVGNKWTISKNCHLEHTKGTVLLFFIKENTFEAICGVDVYIH